MDKAHLSLGIALLSAASGALLARWLGFPVPLLIGSSLAAGLVALMGLRFSIPRRLMHIGFMLIGINIGSGVDQLSFADLAKWPASLGMLTLSVVATLLAGVAFLRSVQPVSRQEAILTASPGHLSFVIALGLERGVNVQNVMILQTIRVFMLTIAVPFLLLGQFEAHAPVSHGIIPWYKLGLMLAIVWLLQPVLARLNVPAPALIAGMVISTFGHLGGAVHGVLHPGLVASALILLGTLIGSRFSGAAPRVLLAHAPLGLGLTLVVVLVAGAFAWANSLLTGIPLRQSFIAYAPGGLEAMIAMSAEFGIDTSFVAAHHILRLFILAPILLWCLRRNGSAAAPPSS